MAGGWLTGRYRKGQAAPESRRAKRMPGCYDLSAPENQRKLDAVEALAVLAEQSGIPLIHLALAFGVVAPPEADNSGLFAGSIHRTQCTSRLCLQSRQCVARGSAISRALAMGFSQFSHVP